MSYRYECRITDIDHPNGSDWETSIPRAEIKAVLDSVSWVKSMSFRASGQNVEWRRVKDTAVDVITRSLRHTEDWLTPQRAEHIASELRRAELMT